MTNRQLEIINSAGKILTREGISGLTIKNIATEMQFSESALYRHFKSKEQIILSMLNYLADGMQERCENAIEQNDSSTLQLENLFAHQISYFKQHPHFVSVVFSDGLLEESERINKAIRKVMRVKYDLLLPIVQDGQLNGEFNNTIKSQNLVEIIMGAFRLQMFKWKSSGFTSDIDGHGNVIIENIISLIQETKKGLIRDVSQYS
ncbi:TetR/AcrR family transcriptional regulator [Psychroflexus sp. CAK8W]|uniref:TetR/AcrR family transcriptional regulator n=1 Tax=Psychroflexus longus TaxID=2873596 RepID=A0ABS7XHN1_9FLAO|nr:TetR/AcrR family transcriptional regulator [Psychroflexus longus]MBZ9778467.1 TetR/AcrR family transcriptional regulator [Psychroflexus longus]